MKKYRRNFVFQAVLWFLVQNQNLNSKKKVSCRVRRCWFLKHVLCCAQSLRCVRFFATPWTTACQAPVSLGIPQARILEWVAMPSSRGSSQPRDQMQVSCIAGREAQEYWSGQPISSPEELPHPAIELGAPALQAFFTAEPPGKPLLKTQFLPNQGHKTSSSKLKLIGSITQQLLLN